MTTIASLIAADPNVSPALKAALNDRPHCVPNTLTPPTEFVHAGHRVVMKAKPSERFGTLFSADITRPDGSDLYDDGPGLGAWFSLQTSAIAEAMATIDRMRKEASK